jgi:hypothetical protein
VAVVAVIVAGAYVLAGAGRGMFDGSSAAAEGWSSERGINIRAGFIAGCSHGVPAQGSICECVFTRIAAAPPYDTPVGFEGLVSSMQRFQASRDPSVLPQAVVAAVRGCTTGHT